MTMPAHLDDEQLSAFIDGEADAPITAEITAHVQDCPACRHRLDTFRRVASAVASVPPPLEADAVDRIVGRAVESLADGVNVIHLGRDRRVRVAQWMTAVAAVVALVVALPMMLRDGGSRGTELADTGARTGDEAEQSADTEAFSARATGAPTAELSSGGAAATSSDAATAGGEGSTDWLGAYVEEDELVRRLVAELSTAPAGSAMTATCEVAAREVGARRVGSMVYANRMSWRDSDAEVVVFALTEPADGYARQAFVMALPGCALLAEPRF